MLNLAECETKGCDRLVKLPAGYCCSACSQADDKHVVLDDDEHSPGCNERQLVYHGKP